jgi:hypothetical protein
MLGRHLKIASLMLVLTLVATAETIPAGTHLTVRTNSTLNSGTARSGQSFRANLVRDLIVDGKTLAKAGSPVKGTVTYAKSSGRLHVPGQLTLRLTSIEINGKMTPISTGGYFAKGKSHTKSNVVKIGGGAAAGALLGGLIGGGKGAGVGALAGAGAGTGVAAATGKQEVTIPAETAITFTTKTNAIVK